MEARRTGGQEDRRTEGKVERIILVYEDRRIEYEDLRRRGDEEMRR